MDTIRRLIVRMAPENREWGDTRSRGARGNLGHQVARGPLANVRQARGLEPAPDRKTRTTWRECLAAHGDVRAAADCFTVAGSTPRGPSWLTFLGHAKDSLWSVDLFRCESAILRTHGVLGVMDQCPRRIVGFGVQAGIVDGRAVCRMFNHAIGRQSSPTYLSSDHDPLYRFHQWHANLRVLRVTEVKTVPYVPLSHPFVERLIGTLRREGLDRMLFWSAPDLERKLSAFQTFYNAHRAHTSLDGRPPVPTRAAVAALTHYRWVAHCRSLYQTPIAA